MSDGSRPRAARPRRGGARTAAALATAAATALGSGLLATGSAAFQPPPAPHLSWVRCVARCGAGPAEVRVGGTLRISARPLAGRMTVVFRTAASAPGGEHAVRAAVVGARRLVVRVPADAVSGPVFVRTSAGRRSNPGGPIQVVRPAPTTPRTAFDGNGMWIWQLGSSQGGDPQAIAAQARRHGVGTVFVKSSDGAGSWSQFSPVLVAALKGAGLRVCAWQYVYGNRPLDEAAAGARAVRTGADCLVIDAEAEYEGKYAAAQSYVRALRAAIGPDYPLGLAGFPYVDYHPAFPYSVFLAPGAAQFNLPQMYWRDIGTTVDRVYAHTYPLNRVYGRDVFPLGQLWQAPPAAEIQRFRQLAVAYGAPGVSWWDWQEASASGWDAIGAPLPALAGAAPAQGWPTVGRGSKGDVVVWIQEHLQGGAAPVGVDGDFGPGTQQAVTDFQSSHGLPVTGSVDPATWPALLRAPVGAPSWGTAARASAAGARASAAGAGQSGPRSARLPAVRDEIHPKRRAAGR